MAPAPELTLASPAPRAWETARILETVAGWPAPQEADSLIPGAGPQVALQALQAQLTAERVAVVGHEPQLSMLAELLLATPALALDWRKGGVMLLALPAGPLAGGATLRWMLPPRVLRALDR